MANERIKYQRREVEWYRKNGRFPGRRIRKDSGGESYVVGDLSWNAKASPEEREFIDAHMTSDVAAIATQSKKGT